MFEGSGMIRVWIAAVGGGWLDFDRHVEIAAFYRLVDELQNGFRHENIDEFSQRWFLSLQPSRGSTRGLMTTQSSLIR